MTAILAQLEDQPFVVPKWAQPLLNSTLLIFYGLLKLGPKRAKILKSQGIKQ